MLPLPARLPVGFSLVAPPPGGLSAAAAQQADPSVQYKNWWDEEHEKVGVGGVCSCVAPLILLKCDCPGSTTSGFRSCWSW